MPSFDKFFLQIFISDRRKSFSCQSRFKDFQNLISNGAGKCPNVHFYNFFNCDKVLHCDYDSNIIERYRVI